MEADGSPSVPQHPKADNEKEGHLLLGPPTFADIGNGRLRCVETGHELLTRDKDSYAVSKGCRRGLIDAFLCGNKPPLNMFKPGPLSASKLVCKLTGDTVNKSEEHIWKHLNGKRFLNKLEQKEMSKLKKMTPAEEVEKDSKKAKKRAKLSKVVEEEPKKDNAEEMERDTKKAKKRAKSSKVVGEESPKLDAEGSGSPGNSEEPDFWVPPVGSRWDLDEGGDRWESCERPGSETDEDAGAVDEEDDTESAELSMRTKRPTTAMGPSNFASRKKKIKTLPVEEKDDMESEELSIRTMTTSIAPNNSALKQKKKKKKIKNVATAVDD